MRLHEIMVAIHRAGSLEQASYKLYGYANNMSLTKLKTIAEAMEADPEGTVRILNKELKHNG